MTAPSTKANRSTSAKTKATTEKEVPVTDTVISDTPVTEDSVTSDTAVSDSSDTATEEKPRIPSVLSGNPILAEFCKQYLEIVDEIAEYNKAVLAEKDSEWNSQKVLAKAKEFASGDTDEEKPEIKSAYDDYEKALDAVNKARKALVDATAKELGINLSSVVERDKEAEGPLKEKRSRAVEIGKQLSGLATLTTDKSASSAVTEFLDSNQLPAVGRDQSRSFTEGGGGSTPKYRVKVEVIKDGNVLLSEDGFTKASLKLTQAVFGYERGQAPKPDKLRAAWESAGNTPEKTVKERVEFVDNELTYVITKK